MTPSHVAAEFVVLNSRHSTLVLEAPAGEAPIWRYWGPRLPDGTTPGTALRDTRPMPPFMLDFDQPLTVFPTFGVGWFGQSALLAHRAGQQFAQALNGCEIEWHEAERALTLHLVDTVAALRVDIDLTLDEASDVLVVCSAITNLGDTPLDVQWFAAGTLPLPGRVQAVRSYAGQHVNEFMLQTDTLSRSLWQRENRRGRTSHDCFPGAVVTTPGAGDDDGLVFGAHLAWSGNHRQAIEWLPDALSRRRDGELTVVWHSVVRQYVAPHEWQALVAAFGVALAANPERPIAWIGMEPVPDGPGAEITLQTAPDQAARLVARCDDHGPPVVWEPDADQPIG